MKQRLLQSLGVSVPQIALGTVELGLPYGFALDGDVKQPTFEEAARLLDAALDLGIRFIDTARAYGDSEEILGRCLAGRRGELVITTKVGPLKPADRSDAELAAEINASVEQSLRLLRTDHVDWLMLHSATLELIEQWPRLYAALDALRRQGKVRALGASIYDDALQASLNQAGIECLQVAASAIDRRVENARAARPADKKDFIVRSVLLRGALAGKYRELPASMKALRDDIAKLDQLAAEAGISLTELAYRYAAGFDGLMLVGTACVEELEQAIGFVERGPLSAEVVAAIQSMDCLEDHLLNPARWPKPEAQTA